MIKNFKKTKIVATIGPASDSEKTLEKLLKAGVDVFRLNFSHGDLDEKKRVIDAIKRVCERVGREAAIIADLPGPKIRLGVFEGVYKISKGQEVSLSFSGEADLPILYDFSDSVSPGQRIYLNDGLVSLKVKSVENGVIFTKALNTGWVTSKKGINLPDTVLKESVFTEEDRKGALFAISEGVEYIAISFVQSKEDVLVLRELLDEHNSPIKIIVKIEKPEAVKNIEEIIIATDAVMVARGDLAIEASAAHVPLIQQKIVALCRQYQKPVIVATQMLESMMENPRPTRAETSDVANAVLAQVDAVMLSGETASGKYPVEAVSTMNSIISAVEADPEFKRYIKINWEKIEASELGLNAIVSVSASLAYRLKSPVISVGTVSGKTAGQLSSFRPTAIIAACTHDAYIARQLSLAWGVYPLVVSEDMGTSKFDEAMIGTLRESGIAKEGSVCVLVWGSEIGVSGTTDTIKSVKI